MTNGVKCFLAFSTGVAIGVAASWRYLKTKYERIAQEEIDDVKEYYREMRGADEFDVRPEDDNRIENDQEKYEELTNGYSTESTSVKIEDDNDPYVISPEEFGNIDDYDTTTFYYYEDGVLADLDDVIVDNADETVGKDFASHYGEYEDDSVHIRNDARKCDYEILRCDKPYEPVKKRIRPDEVEE